jgi:hypothetical protein
VLVITILKPYPLFDRLTRWGPLSPRPSSVKPHGAMHLHFSWSMAEIEALNQRCREGNYGRSQPPKSSSALGETKKKTTRHGDVQQPTAQRPPNALSFRSQYGLLPRPTFRCLCCSSLAPLAPPPVFRAPVSNFASSCRAKVPALLPSSGLLHA